MKVTREFSPITIQLNTVIDAADLTEILNAAEAWYQNQLNHWSSISGKSRAHDGLTKVKWFRKETGL
jgi:hypothetical protein